MRTRTLAAGTASIRCDSPSPTVSGTRVRQATVSSDLLPGDALTGTAETPVHVITGGGGAAELQPFNVFNSGANADVMEVIEGEIAVIKGWVESYYTEKGEAIPTKRI